MKYAKVIKFKEHELLLTCSDRGITSLNVYKNQDLSSYITNNTLLDKYSKTLEDYFNGKRINFEVFDLDATNFQLDVWKTVFEIPFGSTTSYLEIAKRLNKPNASRSVGSALGKNPILVLIPCHRAIRTNGSIGGFNTTIKLKQDLINYEKDFLKEKGTNLS